MTTLYVNGDRIARQTMLPEDRCKGRLKVRFIPNVGTQCSPIGIPRLEIGFVDSKALRIDFRYELRLTWHWSDVLRVDRFAQTHVIVATQRVTIGLIIYLWIDVEVHTTAYILNDKTITARSRYLEIDIPHIGADKILLTCLIG